MLHSTTFCTLLLVTQVLSLLLTTLIKTKSEEAAILPIALNTHCPPTRSVCFSEEPQSVGYITDQFIPSWHLLPRKSMENWTEGWLCTSPWEEGEEGEQYRSKKKNPQNQNPVRTTRVKTPISGDWYLPPICERWMIIGFLFNSCKELWDLS